MEKLKDGQIGKCQFQAYLDHPQQNKMIKLMHGWLSPSYFIAFPRSSNKNKQKEWLNVSVNIKFLLQQNLIIQKAYNQFKYGLVLISPSYHWVMQRGEGRQKCNNFVNFGCEGCVQSLVQWCLINHFLLIRKAMYNPYNMTFQPFYIYQAPNNLYSSFIIQDSLPILLQGFPLYNNFQNHFNQLNIAANQIDPSNDAVSIPNKQLDAIKASLEDQNIQKANIIKEKIIKKLANRPATYLTEKKFYLAQPLNEDSNSNRKLRPRNLKKKHHRTHEKVITNKEVSLQSKDQDLLIKEDKGISSFQEQFQEKKLQQIQHLNVQKTMNSIDSSASEEKK